MKSNRIIPIINLVGCAILIAVVIAQSIKDGRQQRVIDTATRQMDDLRLQLDAEKARGSGLERDVAQLKESIEATVQAKKEAEDTFTKAITERDAQTTEIVKKANEQSETWQRAITERDEKLRALSAELAAARKRLDEAVAKLKEAGAN